MLKFLLKLVLTGKGKPVLGQAYLTYVFQTRPVRLRSPSEHIMYVKICQIQLFSEQTEHNPQLICATVHVFP